MNHFHRLSLLALTLAVVGCQHNLATDVVSSPMAATPEEVARQFVRAISEGELEKVRCLFISHREFASVFSAPDLDNHYEQFAKRFSDSLGILEPEMQGAKLVRMNMSFALEPTLVKSGKFFGPLKTKVDILALDNVHAVVLLGDLERDLKLDELFRVGDSWRLIDAITLEPRK